MRIVKREYVNIGGERSFSPLIWRLYIGIGKGKLWSAEDEKKLKVWVTSGVSVGAFVFSFDGQYTKMLSTKRLNG